MVKYKGQACEKVCMPKKPVKWGFGAAPVLAMAISARFRYTRVSLTGKKTPDNDYL